MKDNLYNTILLYTYSTQLYKSKKNTPLQYNILSIVHCTVKIIEYEITFEHHSYNHGRSSLVSIRIISIHYTTIRGMVDRNDTNRNRRRPSSISDSQLFDPRG